MKDLVEYIAREVVDNPDEVRVSREADDDDYIIYQLHVAPDDIGKVIGRRGRVAKAMRTFSRSEPPYATSGHWVSKSTDLPMPPGEDDWMLVGRVAGAFGLKGEVKVGAPYRLSGPLYATGVGLSGSSDRKHAIEGVRHHKHVLLFLEGVETRDQARKTARYRRLDTEKRGG